MKTIRLLLRDLPTDRGFGYQVLLMERPIAEVVASQRIPGLPSKAATEVDATTR